MDGGGFRMSSVDFLCFWVRLAWGVSCQGAKIPGGEIIFSEFLERSRWDLVEKAKSGRFGIGGGLVFWGSRGSDVRKKRFYIYSKKVYEECMQATRRDLSMAEDE